MKKLLCIVPALVLFAIIGAPNASADSYSATFACNPTDMCPNGPPPAENVSFPAPIIEINFLAQSINVGALDESVVLPTSDAPSDSYIWFIVATEFTTEPLENTYFYDTVGVRDVTNGLITPVNTPTAGGAPIMSGEYGGPLMFSPASAETPEPTPIILLLLGVGLIFFTRRRILMRIPRNA